MSYATTARVAMNAVTAGATRIEVMEVYTTPTLIQALTDNGYVHTDTTRDDNGMRIQVWEKGAEKVEAAPLFFVMIRETAATDPRAWEPIGYPFEDRTEALREAKALLAVENQNGISSVLIINRENEAEYILHRGTHRPLFTSLHVRSAGVALPDGVTLPSRYDKPIC